MLSAVLIITLTVAQGTLVDIFAPRLIAPGIARPVVALYTGLIARVLAEPVMGRGSALLVMATLTLIASLLPPGGGLSGLLLVPLALTLFKHLRIKDGENDQFI